MKVNSYKIIGILLVMILAVSFVGSVSADTVYYDVDIVGGSLALTKDVPVWPATEYGYFVPAESGVGAIRQAYVDGFIGSVNLTYDNNTKAFSVVDINGLAANNTHSWVVKVGDDVLTSVLTGVDNNSVVKYLYTLTSDGTVVQEYDITVTLTDANIIWDDCITFTTGMTGEQALAAASNNQQNFTYNVTVTDAGTTYEYVWLVDVNGISKDWYKTGYGYAIALDGNATDALNRFTVDNAEVFTINMAASSYGGLPYDGSMTTFCSDGYGGYYYEDGITDSLIISDLTA